MFIIRAVSIIALIFILSFSAVGQPSVSDRVKFNDGIGYYIFYDGRANFLRWPQEISKQFQENMVLKIPKNTEFYVYGLDFSQGYVSALAQIPLAPPHLAGIGMIYLNKGGDFSPMFSARFVPIPGYAEKTYRIYLDGIDILLRGRIGYDYFALRVVPDNPRSHTGQAYLFRFQEDDVKIAALVNTFADKIASGSALEGVLSASQFAAIGSPSAQDIKITLQFGGYNPKTNSFTAIIKLPLEGKQIKFDGEKVSPRELRLTRSDDKNTTTYLFLRGDGMLVGSWTQFGLLSFTNLNVVIKVE
jgi:hypothetical protein